MVTDETLLSLPPPDSSYTVVLRCTSSARFRPEEGQLVTIGDLPDIAGEMQVRLRTRWLDQGHDAPVPRELWIEARCVAASLDVAVSTSTSVARMLVSLIAFCTNVRCGTPEVHLAYDSTPGHTEREFLEVFLPDEGGLPREGRLIDTNEFTAVYEAFDGADEVARLSRAFNQYELALRYWYFGGEYLALSHLYMAVEALTKPVIRAKCMTDGIDEAELARRNNIDPDDPERPRWRPALDAWARGSLIFQADNETYEAAKSASDGVEHGFMEMTEVHKRALAATEATFGYVRVAITDLLGIQQIQFPDLVTRPPRDVQSLRKMVKGKFVGAQDDIAPPGEEYPYLEWQSNVRTISRRGDEFQITFNERFTVRCHPDVAFQGLAIQARVRLEAGQDPMKLELTQGIEQTGGTEEPARDVVFRGLHRASSFAAPLAKLIGEKGVRPVQALSLFRFSMQLALFESIQTLLNDDRAPESLTLMHGLIRNTCLLQLSATEEHGAGVAIQARLDALDRSTALFDDSAVTERSSRERSALERVAEAEGVQLPYVIPDLSTAPFFMEYSKDAAFVEEVILSDLAATQLHLELEDGSPAFRTQSTDSRLRAGAASLAISALTASAVALAEVCNHDYDGDRARELRDLAETLDRDRALPDDREGSAG